MPGSSHNTAARDKPEGRSDKFPTLHVKPCSLEDGMRTSRPCHVSAADTSTAALLWSQTRCY